MKIKLSEASDKNALTGHFQIKSCSVVVHFKKTK